MTKGREERVMVGRVGTGTCVYCLRRRICDDNFDDNFDDGDDDGEGDGDGLG